MIHVIPATVGILERKGRSYLYSAFKYARILTKHPDMDHTVLHANNTMPAFPSWAFARWHHHNNWGSKHPVAAYYSFINPERMKGWVAATLLWQHNVRKHSLCARRQMFTGRAVQKALSEGRGSKRKCPGRISHNHLEHVRSSVYSLITYKR